jgi:hypothetical protein
MTLDKSEEKDQVITAIMTKIIDKVDEDQKKGIINVYNPTNIYLKNFNQNNLNAMIINFGVPITNKKNKNDGLYLSPEFLNGQGHSTKSLVFWLGVLWDELVHYQPFYLSMDNIINPTCNKYVI